MISGGDIAKAVMAGDMAAAPKMQRDTASTLTLSTTWQTLDLATLRSNSFPLVDGTNRLVDWNVTSDLITFNGQYDRNYLLVLNAKIITTGLLGLLSTPSYAQFRFRVPDGVSPGTDFFFPFSASDGFMDLQTIDYNKTLRHQQITPVTADVSKRVNGLQCQMRFDAVPTLGTVTLPYFSLLLIAV